MRPSQTNDSIHVVERSTSIVLARTYHPQSTQSRCIALAIMMLALERRTLSSWSTWVTVAKLKNIAGWHASSVVCCVSVEPQYARSVCSLAAILFDETIYIEKHYKNDSTNTCAVSTSHIRTLHQPPLCKHCALLAKRTRRSFIYRVEPKGAVVIVCDSPRTSLVKDNSIYPGTYPRFLI